MTASPKALTRDDLLTLRTRYDTEQKDNLNFCYQYLNFYTGLLVTILGATIAGILQIQQGRLRDLVLLAGPIITIILAVLGYSNVKVFYRRFIEAWITIRNIEEMLGDEYAERSGEIARPPLFRSKQGGFVARFERYHIAQIITSAQAKGIKAEDVVELVTEAGDTLSYAKRTFSVFIGASIILFIAIILTTYQVI
jgi:hypothetical protein